SHQNLTKAYRRALSGDPVSAFGGIVAANCKITAETAGEMIDTFYEIVIAPEYEPAALEILKKKKNLRILQVPLLPFSGVQARYLDYRRVKGGLLVQVSDSLSDEDINLNVVTNRQPTEEEMLDLLFAWKAVKHIKSNAIVFAKDMVLLGMGAGQPNRVVSVKLAGEKAGDKSSGAVMASDAMFPFSDSVEQAAEYGITAIIQPGGSIRDEQSITAANNHGIAMVFTGTRHFLH
ncbi:MAG: bifunctional phosphoribosylaminoimidazolecarboxamide formyltransferase/IMP cyclohydrolase, partial [Chloroflexi bacterium]|nr:bifunctional phosphoribosylaminoimidazolecarboxamide formyltransferase/IMP cyclohydrolase [Chloroflexota bacterium]